MKHLKKFENTNNKNFDISEISDIIAEFADSFEVEEDDIEIFYCVRNIDHFVSLEELRDDPSILKHIENLLEIIIPRSEIGYDDFFQEYEDNIKIWEKLKSLNGKLETLGCYIAPNSFHIDINDYFNYTLSIRKIG
jgi:hypothetical protein